MQSRQRLLLLYHATVFLLWVTEALQAVAACTGLRWVGPRAREMHTGPVPNQEAVQVNNHSQRNFSSPKESHWGRAGPSVDGQHSMNSIVFLEFVLFCFLRWGGGGCLVWFCLMFAYFTWFFFYISFDFVFLAFSFVCVIIYMCFVLFLFVLF